MRVAVVGHVEWVDFIRVERVPVSGEIVHARAFWQEPGGGGAVAAVQLLKLAGGAILFTAFGDDELGHRAREGLRRLGLRVEAVFRPTSQRRAVTHIDAAGERTITVLGERVGANGDDPLPWHELEGTDAVFFTQGDQAALTQARRARVLVATSRILPMLRHAHVGVDALVGSALDDAEAYHPGDLDPAPHMVVRTAGEAGGTFETAGNEPQAYSAASLPGPIRDSYGCGDSFAAGLAYGLGAGEPPEAAVALAARCGAAVLTGRGPYEGQLRGAT